MGYRLGKYHIIAGDDNTNTITEVAVSGNGMIIGEGNTLDGARNLIVGRNNILSSGSDSNTIIGDNNNFEDTGCDRNLVQGYSHNVSGADFSTILGGNQTAYGRYNTFIGSGNHDGYGVQYGLMAGRSNIGTISAYYSQFIAYSGTAANGYYQTVTGIDASGNMGGALTHSS